MRPVAVNAMGHVLALRGRPHVCVCVRVDMMAVVPPVVVEAEACVLAL